MIGAPPALDGAARRPAAPHHPIGHARDTSAEYRSVAFVATVHLFVTLAVTGALLFVDLPPAEVVQTLCVALLALFGWTLYSTHTAFGAIFSPYGLFATSAFLFSAGQPMLEAVGLMPTAGIFMSRFTADTVGRTLCLVLLGLAWMHAGALLAALWFPVVAHPPEERVASTPLTSTNLRQIGWALVTISIIPNVVLLSRAVVVVITSGYEGLYLGEAQVGVGAAPSIIAMLVIPGALLVLGGAGGRTFEIRAVASIVGTYATVQFVLGGRSSATLSLVAFAWLWHRVVKPIPTRLLVGGAAALMFVIFPTVFVVRSMTGMDRFNPSVMLDTYLQIENPIIGAISEIGGTARTIAHTIELVPVKRGHGYGEGFLYALATIVPNFFWSIHPTVARGVAATWLIAEVEPYAAAHGGGLGYSFIAEAYLEFGWFGAPVVMLLYGLAIAGGECWARRSGSAARMATMAAFLSFFLRFPRDETASMVRPLVWYILLPYLVVIVGERRRSASLRRNAGARPHVGGRPLEATGQGR